MGSQELVAHTFQLGSGSVTTLKQRKGGCSQPRGAQKTRAEKCRLSGARTADGWRRRRERREVHRWGCKSQTLPRPLLGHFSTSTISYLSLQSQSCLQSSWPQHPIVTVWMGTVSQGLMCLNACFPEDGTF